MAPRLAARVVAATQGRDRVLDAVKVLALLAVVAGHSLAWHINDDGNPGNVLETHPGFWWITWVVQVLPLFFAAGAVANLGSLRATGAESSGTSLFIARRIRRLLAPVLVYAGLFTVTLMPISGHEVANALGRLLSQLLWFAAVYILVVTAAPWTSRWVGAPWLTFGLWIGAIVLVDLVRFLWMEAFGWVNLVLVWGLLHQVGYHLEALRRAPKWLLGAGIASSMGVAAILIYWLPYSRALVTVSGDTEASNLAPPSVVMALVGIGEILALALVWPLLAGILSKDRHWVPIALLGARGMGIYLWHIPFVGIAVGLALVWHRDAEPLTLAWFGAHLGTFLCAAAGAWLVAGLLSGPEKRIGSLTSHWPRVTSPAGAAAVSVASGLLVLDLSVTGFATVFGPGALGSPSSAPILVLAIAGLMSLLPRDAAS